MALHEELSSLQNSIIQQLKSGDSTAALTSFKAYLKKIDEIGPYTPELWPTTWTESAWEFVKSIPKENYLYL